MAHPHNSKPMTRSKPFVRIPAGSKVITSIKRHAFRHMPFNPANSNAIELVDSGLWVPRLGEITPLELDMSYGPSSVSASHRVELFWVLVDVDNLPLIGGASSRAIWSAYMRWIATTAVGINQVMIRENADFFNPATFSFTERADFTQRIAVALVMQTTDGNVNLEVVGVFTYQETIIQRKFGGDNATFDIDDGDWEDFASDEDDEDND